MRSRWLAVLVPGSLAVLLGVQVLLDVLGGPRATVPGLFSVRLPSGWRQVAAQGPQPDRTHPDAGALQIEGPGQRRVFVDWMDIDVRHGEGFSGIGFDVDAQREDQLGAQIAGREVGLTVWHTTDDANGGIEADMAVVDSLQHPLGDRTVAFTAFCGVGPPTSWNYVSRRNSDWSWCVDALDSWRWESGAS